MSSPSGARIRSHSRYRDFLHVNQMDPKTETLSELDL